MTMPIRNATGSWLRSSVGIKAEIILFVACRTRIQARICLRLRCASAPADGRREMWLAARCEPLHQLIGQPGFLHPLLNRGNVIRHAPKFEDVVIQVEDRK